MSRSLLNPALAYAARGWQVFPCRPREKIPLTAHGVKDATSDPQKIIPWWTRWPDANIGLACGLGSGVYVIDVDVDSDKGINGWESIEDRGISLPHTVHQRTPRGGGHYFYAVTSPNRPPANKNSYFPGVDIRGDGYYVLLAPSVHPNGKTYEWAESPETTAICEYPTDMCPKPRPDLAPWERQAVPPKAADKTVARSQGITIIDRASAYLRECPPAIQGHGGHDALLWAARAMVIGFELSDADALSLLWAEFNPRCVPPWDRSHPAEVKDFERKISEVRRTPGEKPPGWLLDEYGLRLGDDALALLGARLRDNLLASHGRKQAESKVETRDQEPEVIDIEIPQDFPLHCFPEPIAEYIRDVAESQVVDIAGVGLGVLVTAGAAMGNSRRLRLKRGFDVPPTLWGMIVARSGSNKSGPFREIIRPLRDTVPIEQINNPMLNPQGQLLIEDTTTESVIDVLSRSPRGLCLANGEGAGWVASFDRYAQASRKKTSVDETMWLKFWDADTYQKNRKTDAENITIPAAAVSVIACIQPEKMAECFDPAQFASGLVPRLLVINLPKRYRGWSERELSEETTARWSDTVSFLRTLPFSSMSPDNGRYNPHVLNLTDAAKAIYVGEFNRLAMAVTETDDVSTLFFAKMQGQIGRIALVLHGLHAMFGMCEIDGNLQLETMQNAIILSRYLLNQQLEIYGLARKCFLEKREQTLRNWILGRGGHTTVRELQKSHPGWYRSADEVRADLNRLVQNGYGHWDGRQFAIQPTN